MPSGYRGSFFAGEELLCVVLSTSSTASTCCFTEVFKTLIHGVPLYATCFSAVPLLYEKHFSPLTRRVESGHGNND